MGEEGKETRRLERENDETRGLMLVLTRFLKIHSPTLPLTAHNPTASSSSSTLPRSSSSSLTTTPTSGRTAGSTDVRAELELDLERSTTTVVG